MQATSHQQRTTKQTCAHMTNTQINDEHWNASGKPPATNNKPNMRTHDKHTNQRLAVECKRRAISNEQHNKREHMTNTQINDDHWNASDEPPATSNNRNVRTHDKHTQINDEHWNASYEPPATNNNTNACKPDKHTNQRRALECKRRATSNKQQHTRAHMTTHKSTTSTGMQTASHHLQQHVEPVTCLKWLLLVGLVPAAASHALAYATADPGWGP